MKLRNAVNTDASPIIDLINTIYIEYGDKIFLEGYDQDLLDIESSFFAQGGAFVVLVDQDAIVGTHATLPLNIDAGIVTHRRLYLRKDYRGGPAADMLMTWAIDWDKANNFRRIELWSDIRFDRAHTFFEKYGFSRTGSERHMNDGAMPYTEIEFVKCIST